MSSYVLAFRDVPGRVPTQEEERAWADWLGGIGHVVTDFGNRVRTVQTLGTDGEGQAMGLTGYIVVEATDEQAAADLAAGCPGLAHGSRVEVAQTVPQA